MKYLKIFEDYKSITSQTDFEQIDKEEYLKLDVGEDTDDFDAMGQYIDDRWVDFTKEELLKLRKVLVRRQPFGDRILINGKVNQLEYKNEIQSLSIIKLIHDWFLVRLDGLETNPGVYKKVLMFKCDGWVGLLKCLKSLKQKSNLIK